MIGKIKGTLIETGLHQGLIETSGGVSYLVFLTPSLLGRFPVGSPLEVYTYLQVRDDAMVLFGFEDKDQESFFTLLLTVPGVGPKTAFNVISHTQFRELLNAVRTNDVEYFTHVPGLGKKTAMKIILELSQKIKSEFKFDAGSVSEDDKTVIDALVSLGYQVKEAREACLKLPAGLTVEEKIKRVLSRASTKKT